MSIALIAPPWFTVPPRGYGGVELVVAHLADGLQGRGHDVTLFAAGGSHTAANLHATYEDPPSELLGDPVVEAAHLIEAYRHWSEFDLIHDHTMLGLVAGANLPVPVVHTVHGQVLERFRPFYESLGGGVHLVCISEHQRSALPAGCSASVIYNGVDLDDYPLGEDAGDHLLFVGRASREKGLLDAIEIARRAQRRLVLLVKVNEPPEEAFFRELVAPALDGLDATVHFQLTQKEKAAAYRGAAATLFPIHWEEPFGLVMAESMASGTPVIAYRRGSVPEVVEDGVTGFVCDSQDEAVAAVGRIPEIDRMACRDRVARLFSAQRNVDAHEALYRQILSPPAPAARDEGLLSARGG